MAILIFFILTILPTLLPILFGVIVGLLVLIPHIRNWNQSYARKIVTSLSLAFFATLAFQFLAAYASAEFTISISRAMNPPVIDNLLFGSRDDIEKELFIRALLPRLDLQPCYSEQKICEIANTIEVYANEGYVPALQESMNGYLWSGGITFLLVWIGSLLAVLCLTIMNQGKTVSV